MHTWSFRVMVPSPMAGIRAPLASMEFMAVSLFRLSADDDVAEVDERLRCAQMRAIRHREVQSGRILAVTTHPGQWRFLLSLRSFRGAAKRRARNPYAAANDMDSGLLAALGPGMTA